MMAKAAAKAQTLIKIRVALHASMTAFGGCMLMMSRVVEDFARARVCIASILAA